MKSSLYYYLTQDAGIISAVSSRIYRSTAPTGSTMPYIVMNYVGAEPSYDQSGRNEYFKRTVEFLCVGNTPDSCDTLAEAVKSALDIQVVEIGDTGDKTHIFATTFLSEFDDFDLIPASESAEYTITQNYEISYMEA